MAKVFKKVVSVVKKVGPALLAAAAIYYTVGSALSVNVGSWSQTVNGLVEQLGAGELLTNVLAGAITTAGYGAVAGAGLSLIQGGSIIDGAQTGALAGGVAGGVAAGFGIGLGGKLPFPASAPGATPSTLGGSPPSAGGGAPSALPAAASNLGGGGPNNVSLASGTSGSSVPPVTPPATGGGLLSFAKDNSALVGGTIAGVGAAIGGLGGADATIEAARIGQETENADRDRIASNFSGSGGLLTPQNLEFVGNQPARPTPAQTPRFNPAPFAGGRYQFNPQKGIVEFVPA